MTEKKKPGPKKGDPRCVEAGRRIGQKNAERGPEYFAELGTKGGNTTLARHGSEHYAAMGRKGGITKRANK